MALERNEHGYVPNFQLRHCRSGEVIQFERLYTAKQLRKLLDVRKEDWSHYCARGHIPECDTYVRGKALWTDTTLAHVLTEHPVSIPMPLTPGQRDVITYRNEESPAA